MCLFYSNQIRNLTRYLVLKLMLLLRTKSTLKILRIIYKNSKKIYLVNKIIRLLDPNNLLKNGFRLNNEIKVIVKDNLKLKYYLDLNEHIDFNIFMIGRFDNTCYSIIKNLDKKFVAKMAFIDIGSNIGSVAISIASLGIKVISIEPLRSNYDKIKINQQLNGIQFDVVNKALVANPSQKNLIIYESPGNRGASSYRSDWHVPNGMKIPNVVDCETLDSLMQGYENASQIEYKFLKIDVEGMESDVLEGGMKFIKQSLPYIFIEWRNDKLTHQEKHRIRNLIEYLKDFYFILVISYLSEDLILTLNFDPELSYENILLVPNLDPLGIKQLFPIS